MNYGVFECIWVLDSSLHFLVAWIIVVSLIILFFMTARIELLNGVLYPYLSGMILIFFEHLVIR